MKQYRLASIFYAYYAAMALNQVKYHTLVSFNEVFDRCSGEEG